MEKKTITIPDGYKVEIRMKDGKPAIVMKKDIKKQWRAKLDSGEYYYVIFDDCFLEFMASKINEKGSDQDSFRNESGNYFRTEEEAQAICDDLNKAIKPIFDKAKRGGYDK